MFRLASFEQLAIWSHEHFSYFPWRKNRSLYKTVISEFMLQQTTVHSVLNYYEPFLKKFPNFRILSQASINEVEKAWKGLGYYRRAYYLLKIAREIKEELSLDRQNLLSMKGIGEYTADILSVIDKNKRVLALDSNIERVLCRIYGIKIFKGTALKKELRRLFQDHKILLEMEHIGSRIIHESLMDLGRTLCQARKVCCRDCFFQTNCCAYKEGDPLQYPMGDKKKIVYKNLDLLRIIVRQGDQILGYQKSKDQWLSGQIEIPTFVISTEDLLFKQYPPLRIDHMALKHLSTYRTTITKYRIKNYIMLMDEKCFTKNYQGKDLYRYFFIEENFSTASLKAVRKIHSITS